MLLKLTSLLHSGIEKTDGLEIHISPRHIVSVRPIDGGSGILTVAGVDYHVRESVESILKDRLWLHSI